MIGIFFPLLIVQNIVHITRYCIVKILHVAQFYFITLNKVPYKTRNKIVERGTEYSQGREAFTLSKNNLSFKNLRYVNELLNST